MLRVDLCCGVLLVWRVIVFGVCVVVCVGVMCCCVLLLLFVLGCACFDLLCVLVVASVCPDLRCVVRVALRYVAFTFRLRCVTLV